MIYRKPICDCGEELYFEVDEIQNVTYRVLKNGKFSKRPINKGFRTSNNFGSLVCRTCKKEYEYNASFVGEHKFKAIRGDEIE